MNISIIGSGAMGSLFGGLLKQTGESVTLLSRNKNHTDAIRKNGIIIEREGRQTAIQISAVHCARELPATDLAIICVKSKDTAEAGEIAKDCLCDKGFVLTLQNGIGHEEILAEKVGRDRIMLGTTSHGATLISPGTVLHAGQGLTVIGRLSHGDLSPVREVTHLMTDAGIKTDLTDHPMEILWKKLIINAGINAITALTQVKNGALTDREDTQWLVTAAAKEAIAVAESQGISIEADIVAQLFQVIQRTAVNRSSMGQDVDRKKETEIDAINGAIVRIAERKNIDVPINRTLTALVKTLESHYTKGWR